jgi:hypothetical protein
VEESNFKNIGVVFVGPIIGLPPSLLAVFDPLKERVIGIEGVDILEGQHIKKNLRTILSLTVLPGSHQKRIILANNYNEKLLFEMIVEKIERLKKHGKTKIIIGGMSGGFIFASRLTQAPSDDEAEPYAAKIRPLIKGLFGISPLLFYPSGVLQHGAALESIPSEIPTILVWGDDDLIIPKGTIPYAERISREHINIKYRIIKGGVKHQFFGGKDFIKPLTNRYWDTEAEKIALQEIEELIKKVI